MRPLRGRTCCLFYFRFAPRRGGAFFSLVRKEAKAPSRDVPSLENPLYFLFAFALVLQSVRPKPDLPHVSGEASILGCCWRPLPYRFGNSRRHEGFQCQLYARTEALFEIMTAFFRMQGSTMVFQASLARAGPRCPPTLSHTTKTCSRIAWYFSVSGNYPNSFLHKFSPVCSFICCPQPF